MNKIIQGDCLESLKKLEDNSIDAIVTDPPYGLSFMGKKWDYDVPSVEIWQECLRVLKPGGYLLSFAGTRTQHRMAVRIEDAGFEIRDMIAWVYGSGFPKSLNIGKAVDKLQGNEREETDYIAPDGKKRWGGNSFSVGEEPDGRGVNKSTKGTSEWEGWGTALKPALEPITVARKPIEGTVAENCLKWGVGGINIDESRVGIPDGDDSGWSGSHAVPPSGSATDAFGVHKFKEVIRDKPVNGRFPSNLLHDNSEEVRECFPDAGKGNGKGAYNYAGREYDNKDTSMFNGDKPQAPSNFNDSGNASRFFKSIIYQAKASKSERNRGCEGLEEKEGIRTNAPRENEDVKTPTRANNHPTVKPIALMEYLVKLVSKEGHTVLDPFAGSGSTLIACKKLKRNYIGMELDPEYIKIAEARLNSIKEENTLF
jgi:site-specific DNA-methyltransferase (adenine-specific)